MAEVDELRRRIREHEATKEKLRVVRKRSVERGTAPDEPVQETPGRLGLVSPETRRGVRQSVSDMGFFSQLGTEMAPATIGSVLGGAAGSFVPGVGTAAGIVGGAAAGGALGELLGQEAGVTPESNVGLAIAGAAPIAGPIVGGGLRAVRSGIGRTFMALPAAKAAAARIEQMRAAGEFESFATQIIGNRQGLVTEQADKLYAAARAFGAEVPAENFRNTFDEIGRVAERYGKFKKLSPDINAAINTTSNVLEGMAKAAGESGALSIDDIVTMYQAVNRMAIAGQKGQGGVKQEVVEGLFEAMSKDLDTIANSSAKGARGAQFIMAATKRAKLDMAIRNFERGVAQFQKDIPGTNDIQLDIGGLHNWLGRKTNPKSPDYDKLIAEELSGELQQIKKDLSIGAKITENGLNPAGKNSLVIRNIGARTGAGIAGLLMAGPVGAGVGAMAGSRIPEGITAVLMTPAGRKLLNAATKMGKGSIPQHRWAAITQAATQAATGGARQALEDAEMFEELE